MLNGVINPRSYRGSSLEVQKPASEKDYLQANFSLVERSRDVVDAAHTWLNFLAWKEEEVSFGSAAC
jgi:hypothetical protein